MRRQYVRNTLTEDENLNEGEKFDQVDTAAMEMQAAEMQVASKKSLPASLTTHIIREDQNFLKIAPQQIFNLKPNDKGLVTTTIRGLPQYSKLILIACDDKSITQRQYTVSELLKTKRSELGKLAKTNSIMRKDLRQN